MHYSLVLCLRHGLIDGFHSVSHGELVHDLLRRLIEVHFPGVIAFSIGDLHHAAVLLLCGVVEDVLQSIMGREDSLINPEDEALYTDLVLHHVLTRFLAGLISIKNRN